MSIDPRLRRRIRVIDRLQQCSEWSVITLHREHHEAVNDVRAKTMTMESLVEKRNSLHAQIRSRLIGTVDAVGLQQLYLMQRCLTEVERDLNEAQMALRQSRRGLEKAQAKLYLARREVKVWEHLSEKATHRLQRQRQDIEQKERDDHWLISGRYRDNSQ